MGVNRLLVVVCPSSMGNGKVGDKSSDAVCRIDGDRTSRRRCKEFRPCPCDKDARDEEVKLVAAIIFWYRGLAQELSVCAAVKLRPRRIGDDVSINDVETGFSTSARSGTV